MREVRCPECGRLLAVVYDNGLIKAKTSRQVIWTERALLSCLKCGSEVLADARQMTKRKGVDKTKTMR